MTKIEILSGDFEILFEDEGAAFVAETGPGLRVVRRTSGATNTVYTTNQLYSAVAEASDDFIAMGFRNPMLPTTPNAYTMENKYFIPRSSTQYLKEGSISADYGFTSLPDTDGNGVVKVKYLVASGQTDFVTADIGKLVTAGDGDTGTLLDFDTDQDGTKVAWIRPVSSDDASGDKFSTFGSPNLTTDIATVTQVAAGVEGDHIFSAIQAIGSVPTATEVYVVQNRRKVQNWDTDGSTDPQIGNYTWWATDPDVSLGIISILMQVKDSGSFIADGDLEVFARRYTALYDNFRLRVQAGGFSALPLASAADINNTTGYRTITGQSGSNTFDVGNAIYVGTDFASADKKGVITAVSGTTADPVIEYYLIGNHGLNTDGTTGYINDFANSDAIKEYDFSTAADGDATCTANGGPSNNSGGPTDTTSGEGGTVTISLGGFAVDHNSNGNNEDYSIQIDAQSNVSIAKVYERIKYVTRRGSNEEELFGTTGQYGPAFDAVTDVATGTITINSHEYSDGDKVIYSDGGGTKIPELTDGGTYYIGNTATNTFEVYNSYAEALYDINPINVTDGVGAAHTLTRVVNIPGETYRGLDGQIEYDASTGTLTEGENIFTTTGGNTWTGRLIHQQATTTGEFNTNNDTYIMTTDSQTSIDSLVNDDVVEDAFGTDDVTVHGAGTTGINTFTSPKSSPFGTFTGTQIFGARGVAYINPASSDVQAYILTDDFGTLVNPPNTITFTVTNTSSLDRVLVARDTGVDGIIDKAQFGGMTATSQGASTITVNSSPGLDDEVPQTGYLRVVDTTPVLTKGSLTESTQEHRYEYSSRDIATDTFTLTSVTSDTGTVTTGPSTTQLIDTGQSFSTGLVPVEVGMYVRNTFAGKTTHVWEVTNVVNDETLDVVALYGDLDATQDWDVGDTYEINKVIIAYTTSDNIYDLIIDAEATTTSISNSFTQSTNFDVVVNVRQGKVILPFTVNQAVTSANVTVTVVRQPDNIAT